MTEKQLLEFRDLVTYYRDKPIPREMYISVNHQGRAFGVVWAIDLLLKAIDERDGIIHDMQLDGQYSSRIILQSFITEMIQWIEEMRHKNAAQFIGNNYESGFDGGLCEALEYLQERSAKCENMPDLLPPDQARVEAVRLHEENIALRAENEMLREVVSRYQTPNSNNTVDQLVQAFRAIASHQPFNNGFPERDPHGDLI